MRYYQIFGLSTWQFKNIPEFRKGSMRPVFADCGKGIDYNSKGDEYSSFAHIFKDVAEEDILSYVSDLKSSGFEMIYENRIDNNLFYKFRCSEGVYSVTFVSEDGRAHFILDRCGSVPICEFNSLTEDTRDCTELMQYSLHYSEMNEGTTTDCGMNYVIRLRDNSLIMIDGGMKEQTGDAVMDDFIDSLRELTKTKDGEKMKISLWICTHPHDDHCDFFTKILKYRLDCFDIERVLFNFPNPFNTDGSETVYKLRDRILTFLPNVKYLKAHTGDEIKISGAVIKFLIGPESMTDTYSDVPCFLWTNEISLVFTIETDGVKTLFLGDTSRIPGDFLIRNYSKETLSCNFIQAAHHGINLIPSVYDNIDYDAVLFPQGDYNLIYPESRFKQPFGMLCEKLGPEKVYKAGSRTDIFTLEDGNITRRDRPHVPTVFDNKDW